MKKIYTLLLVLLAGAVTGFGQCVPDTSITHNVTGIYPDSTAGLPHATVGIPYLTDMQFCVPANAVYLGQNVVIDSMRIVSVLGLPPGFTYSCTPTNCIFLGGTTSCIQITGSAPTSGMIGNYPLTVNLKVSGRLLGIFAQQIDTTNSNYTIVIDENTGLPSISPTAFQVAQNKPNPFRGKTEVMVSSPTSEMLHIKVCDLLGNVLQTETIQVPKGNNNISISSEDLSPGIYLYTISNGRSSKTRRMIVSGN